MTASVLKWAFLSCALCLAACTPVMAGVIGVNIGTANPPPMLGGYTMNPYEPGTIAGENYTAHEVNGNGVDGWATWGQNYTGLVHVVIPSKPLTITLSGVRAVDFYEEPNHFSDFNMTATDSSGTSVTTLINGNHGSSGVGFYETNPADTLTSITVTCTDSSGFAVGEFGLDNGSLTGGVPEPSTVVLFGLGGLACAVGYVRRRRAA